MKITKDFRVSALRRGIAIRSKKAHATPANITYAATLELANLGFLVKPQDLEGVSKAALTTLIADASEVMGADREWTAIYPGFPEQVEALDTLTLIVEQILHYWTGGAFLPNYPTVAREGLPLDDMVRRGRALRVLEATPAALALADELVSSPIAMSEDERALLRGALELAHPSLETVAKVAGKTRNGENLQVYVESAFAVGSFSSDELIQAVVPVVANSDQVLRTVLAVASAPSAAQWEHNYGLAVNTLSDKHSRAVRMNKLSRASRRAVIARLGQVSKGFNADQLVARQGLWRGVMRTVHPYDFSLSSVQKRAVDIIHSNGEYRTLNSQVELAMEQGDAVTAVELLAEHQPGNLLRRLVALLRVATTQREAKVLAKAVSEVGSKSTLTTLISAFNGALSANDENARVTRVAGLNNKLLDRSSVVKVKEAHLALVLDGLRDAMRTVLASSDAPEGAVAVASARPVPLVRRDAATADRVLDRGEEVEVAGDGDVLRIFGHWSNNQMSAGYMDIGVVILDESCAILESCTWDSWQGARGWATYSGDKLVQPGDSAPEFFDIKLKALRKENERARYAAMTVQSYSGWPMAEVDFIAGAMLRSDATKGKTFDARAVVSAFKPTTMSTQAVPYVVDLETGRMIWIDTSNGSTASGMSSSRDNTVGSLVYDELLRPRFTLGDLASLWAEAHGAETLDEAVDRDALVALLG